MNVLTIFAASLLLAPAVNVGRHTATPVPDESSANSASVSLQVTNVPTGAKRVTVVLFDSPMNMEQAAGEKMISKARGKWKLHSRVIDVTPVRGAATVSISQLTPGYYAAMVFCDLDGDRKLNVNLLGIPKEPLGASGTALKKFPPKERPNWKNTRFLVRQGGNRLTVPVITPSW